MTPSLVVSGLVFQRWVRTDNLREKIQTFTTHPDFEFVSESEANLCIGRVGGGPSGKVFTEWENRSSNSHYFIRAKNDEVIENLTQLQQEFVSLAREQSNGLPSLSKNEIVHLLYEDLWIRTCVGTFL